MWLQYCDTMLFMSYASNFKPVTYNILLYHMHISPQENIHIYNVNISSGGPHKAFFPTAQASAITHIFCCWCYS